MDEQENSAVKAIMRHAKMDMTLTTAIARKKPSARRSKITRSAFHQSRCGCQNQLRSEKRDPAHHSSKAFEKQTYMSLENVLRGSGDIGALCATCGGVKQVDGSANGIRRLIPNLYRALALTI